MIYEYIKGITLLSIFLALIEMILPSKKFSKYIKLVLGFILMVNIILPFVNLNNYSFDLKNFEDINFEDEKFDYSQYVEASNTINEKAINQGVKSRISEIWTSEKYEINEVAVEYEINSDIVVFESIDIVLREKRTTVQSDKLIEEVRIEKIEVGGLKKDIVKSEIDETTEIINLKTSISKEYNLSIENIYVR